MSTVQPYEIWIPSRRRVPQAVNCARLLPTAKVFVDEREYDDYAAAIPPERIVTHPPSRNAREMRTMAILQCPTPWLIMCDDDLVGVQSLVGRRVRKLDSPGELLQILENMVNVCSDLGVKLFGFNRNPHPGQFSAADPFAFNSPAAACWGICGKELLPDSRLTTYEDIDLAMACLLKNRVVMSDRRFYWNFGPVWYGQGGCQGIRTSETEETDRLIMRRKWGGWLDLGVSKNSFVGNKTSFGMSIKVTRKSHLSSTR